MSDHGTLCFTAFMKKRYPHTDVDAELNVRVIIRLLSMFQRKKRTAVE